MQVPVEAEREPAVVSYSISEAQHSGDGPMAGHDDAHLSSTTHQQNLETRPKL